MKNKMNCVNSMKKLFCINTKRVISGYEICRILQICRNKKIGLIWKILFISLKISNSQKTSNFAIFSKNSKTTKNVFRGYIIHIRFKLFKCSDAWNCCGGKFKLKDPCGEDCLKANEKVNGYAKIRKYFDQLQDIFPKNCFQTQTQKWYLF